MVVIHKIFSPEFWVEKLLCLVGSQTTKSESYAIAALTLGKRVKACKTLYRLSLSQADNWGARLIDFK